MQAHNTAASQTQKLDRKRLRQVLFSIPRYLRELKHLHNPRDLYQWTTTSFHTPFHLRRFRCGLISS
jgi:hypothetical protein